MNKLKDILQGLPVTEITGDPEVVVRKLYIDSREVTASSAFIAVKGLQSDGHQFITKAIDQGARIIICEEMPSDRRSHVTYVKMQDTRLHLGQIAARYYDFPSEKIKVIGVTGTNGKTTIATLLYRMFRLMGKRSGLLSTVINYIDSKAVEATHTTPDPIQIQRLLSKMVEANCSYCFMEVSSHAIHQHRINGIRFQGGIFTNLTHDHLDYHKTFEEYIKAKKAFFDALPSDAFALTNLDDKNGKVMVQNTQAKVHTYAQRTMADFTARVVESHIDGMLLNMDGAEMWSKLIGGFNASNLLAIYSAAVLLGLNKQTVLTELSDLRSVDGRFEHFSAPSGFAAVVDYAHTPDALVNVLGTLRQVVGDGKIYTVVGAGGNRDKSKRPVMARVCAELSDQVVLTSDNPRNEDPMDILNDMKAGLDAVLERKVLTLPDRKEAIRMACKLAGKGDVVLVAGKGHETYQEVQGVKHWFDDRQVVKEIINELR